MDISFHVGGLVFKRLQGLNSQIVKTDVGPLKTVNDNNRTPVLTQENSVTIVL